jgi:hypothetical protein
MTARWPEKLKESRPKDKGERNPQVNRKEFRKGDGRIEARGNRMGRITQG